jgi:hypothetical protein
MHLVHAVRAIVWLNGVAELAAAEQAGEELVEMGEKVAWTGQLSSYRCASGRT